MPVQTRTPKKPALDLTYKSIVKVLLVLLAVYLLFVIRDIILIVFVALVLSSAFNPWVDGMQKHRIPRPLGILIIILAVFAVIGVSVYLIIPPIIAQANDLVGNFPNYWNRVSSGFDDVSGFLDSKGLGDNINNMLVSIQEGIGSWIGDLAGRVYGLIGGVFSLFMIVVLTFYFSVQDKFWKKGVLSVVPEGKRPYAMDLVSRMQAKIGLWLRGQIALCVIIFGLSWLGLSFLGIKYAVVLALFAGILEFIPFIGPIISAIPAIFVGLTQSLWHGVAVLILYVVIQQLENLVIVPNVMKKAVGLNPVVIIIVILIGAKLAGILGILLAVPVATALSVALSDYLDGRRSKGLKNA